VGPRRMGLLYSIIEWDQHFEKSQSRRDGSHKWVAVPTKHDGKGYRRIMLREDGPMIYGAWVLIVQVAAKCPRRGVLRDADGPLTPEDLAIKTSAPVALFRTALKVLCSNEIKWMKSTEIGVYTELPQSGLPLQDSTDITTQVCGEDATVSDQSEDGSGTAASYPQAFEDFWLAYPTRGGRKRGKGKCYGMWRQAIRAAERQSLVEAAQTYAASDDATRGFAKDPERFLAKDWWRDWLPSSEPIAPGVVQKPPSEIKRRIAPANFLQ